MTTKEVADQLVALCRAGKNLEAVETLLSADVVSVEPAGNDAMPAVQTGRDAIRGKNEWWQQNHKIHSAKIKGPFPNGDRFAVILDFEVTPKAGPMAGKRFRMEEVALYTVSEGKITREEFFYDMSGGGEAPAKKAARKKPEAKQRRPAPQATLKASKTRGGKAKVKGKTRRR